ncbi:MAG: hypothetical protein RLZZ239_732, partial [Pseudomonadota bacterium]
RSKPQTWTHSFAPLLAAKMAMVLAVVMGVLMAWPVSAQNAPATPAKKAAPPSAAAALQARANAEAKAQAQSQAKAQGNAQAKASASASAVIKPDAKADATAARGPNNPSPAVVAPVSPEASADDLAIAQQIHQGLLPCEMGTSIRVEADAAQPGYFHVQGKGFRYRMFPVRTNTGALRLEDKKAGAVWLQLANKSMLMDEKKGRRVADECAHPDQMAFSEKMKTNPLPSLLD